MGLLLDIVPNHMGIGKDSVWWQDVLENGHASRYANYFDIDWSPLKAEMRDKLLLPILGNQYGEELEAKHIQVAFEDGRFYVKYYDDHRMPASPRSIPLIFFRRPIGTLPSEQETAGMPHELVESSARADATAAPRDDRSAAAGRAGSSGWRLCCPGCAAVLTSEAAQPAIARALWKRSTARRAIRTASMRCMSSSNVQPYRLAYWRTSAEEINYRRFFDVNDLVGLRMETPEVFAETHCLIRELLASKQVTGLRIDHCDGMFNPRQYLIRLQLLYLASQCAGPKPAERDRRERDRARGARPGARIRLERLARTTLRGGGEDPGAARAHAAGVAGARDLRLRLRLLRQQHLHPARQREGVQRLCTTRVLGHPRIPDEIIYRSKLQVMQNSLASEVHVLTNMLSKIAAADRHARDFTDNMLESVVRETIACFPVYRTYTDERGTYPDRDIAFIRSAIRQAKRRNPDIDASAFDFLADMLLLHRRAPDARAARSIRSSYASHSSSSSSPGR